MNSVGMTEDTDSMSPKPKCVQFREWFGGPSCLIYVNYFCSQWGDWMWLFASGLYLVHLDGGVLRLAAALGFTAGACVLLFGGLIGEWVDRNPRLYVVRVALFIQNLSVVVCSVFVCMALHYEIHGGTMLTAFEACIVVFAVIAQLASVGYKISIEKDWIVVVAKDDKAFLANLNAVTRTLDLFAKILAPTVVGLVMTYASLLVSAVCIAVWNLVSVWVEYALLHRIHSLVPELRCKKLRTGSPGSEEEMTELRKTENISPCDEKIEKIITNDTEKEPLNELQKEKESDPVIPTDGSEPTESEPLKAESEKVTPAIQSRSSELMNSCLEVMFEPFIVLVRGWRTYAGQKVVFAGLSLAMLYMTVMGFDSVTTGYIYSNRVPEYVVGISMALAGGTGILGALLFTILRPRIGLERTGLLAFNLEILCLLLAVAAVWAPGSPFDLNYATREPVNCTLPDNTTLPQTSTLIASPPTNNATGMKFPEPFEGTAGEMVLEGATYGRMKREQWEEVAAGQFDPLHRESLLSKPERCDEEDTVNVSIILFLIGIILSRIGLWMADLVVTQLLQENVVETERGVVNGVQNSLNMLLEMLKFVLVIFVPRIETFGLLIILSFIFICLASVLFVVHSYRVRGHLFNFERCLCRNNNCEKDSCKASTCDEAVSV